MQDEERCESRKDLSAEGRAYVNRPPCPTTLYLRADGVPRRRTEPSAAERGRRPCRACERRSPPQFEIGHRDDVTCYSSRLECVVPFSRFSIDPFLSIATRGIRDRVWCCQWKARREREEKNRRTECEEVGRWGERERERDLFFSRVKRGSDHVTMALRPTCVTIAVLLLQLTGKLRRNNFIARSKRAVTVEFAHRRNFFARARAWVSHRYRFCDTVRRTSMLKVCVYVSATKAARERETDAQHRAREYTQQVVNRRSILGNLIPPFDERD